MEINITLPIQIINFLTTYFFLNSFLFKPVIAALRQKKAHEQKLLDDIARKEARLLEEQKQQHRELLTFQADVKNSYPQLETLPPISAGEISYERDPKEVAFLIKKSSQLIVQRVTHVD